MRRFSSYGPVDTALHYYVPRQELVDRACAELLGEDPTRGGHYITVWAPRQRGKTWVMGRAVALLRREPTFQTVYLTLEHLKTTDDLDRIAQLIARDLCKALSLAGISVRSLDEFDQLFTRDVLTRPLILILDEFDSLTEGAISGLAAIFRNIYLRRQQQTDRLSAEKDYLLHGVALIGVRGVLGIESRTGSPFNVQRGLFIPNLTFAEVEAMFRWYARESGQTVEQAVIERVYAETRGQPGLTSWLGELLTETYNPDPRRPLDLAVFEQAYGAALNILPNANILNLISKARQEPYRATILELFKTDAKMPFRYDDPPLNFLYQNGVIDWEQESPEAYYVRFPSPFVQKRLFNTFARELVADTGRLYAAFEDLAAVITAERVHVANLLRRFERYLAENRAWLLQDAPRKSNLRLYEAVFHFILYRYLADFLQSYRGRVWPEFPTGNGKVDPSTGSGQALLLAYAGVVYGLEVKSFTNLPDYQRALRQAAAYGRQLGLAEMTLALFLEQVDDANRARYEAVYTDAATGVRVAPVFVQTGR
jgi:hypothetical protein